MASITVRVRSYAPAVARQARGRAEQAIRKAALDIEAHAKGGSPVETGALRNAINANGGGLDWRVDSPANYSLFQEFGTRFMAAHPYMLPALEAVRPSLVAALRRIT